MIEYEYKNRFLKITKYKMKPNEPIKLNVVSQNQFYILLNYGHIIKLRYSNEDVFLPSSNGIMGIERYPKIILNKNQNCNFIVIRLSSLKSREVAAEINKIIENKYYHILKSHCYSFSFSSNTSILNCIDDLVYAFQDVTKLRDFELQNKSLSLIISCLKVVLFNDYKHITANSTFDTIYYLILKMVLESPVSLEEAFNKYRLPPDQFYSNFHFLNSDLNFQTFYKRYRLK